MWFYFSGCTRSTQFNMFNSAALVATVFIHIKNKTNDLNSWLKINILAGVNFVRCSKIGPKIVQCKPVFNEYDNHIHNWVITTVCLVYIDYICKDLLYEVLQKTKQKKNTQMFILRCFLTRRSEPQCAILKSYSCMMTIMKCFYRKLCIVLSCPCLITCCLCLCQMKDFFF